MPSSKKIVILQGFSSKTAKQQDPLPVILEYNEPAIRAFMAVTGVQPEEVEYDVFQSCYMGQFDSHAEFVKYCIDNFSEHKMPSWVVIDYERTWSYNLCHDYDEYDGYYFKHY